ncbi:hypothetical protein O9X98_07955 [Agrobacterium salinitolerans]|nr:hypothetical protein [Agrobacterium salinitolerans]
MLLAMLTEGNPEADIVINGVKLTPGQSMALRVACTSYMSEMSEPGKLGDDAHGEAMRKGYHEHMEAILGLIIR